jgi:hypothetical protein
LEVIVLGTVEDPSVQRAPLPNLTHPRLQTPAFVLLLLYAAGCICAEQALAQGMQPENGQRTLHGTVVNSVTREPIGRALVYSSGDRMAMLTDSEGHFEFTPPKAGAENRALQGQPQPLRPIEGPGGRFWLMARKPGFLDDPNERRQVLALPGTEVTISLLPEALIKGRVIVSAGDAAVGIGVQVFSRQIQEGVLRWMPGPLVRANSNGEFCFAELLPGAYKLVTHELMDKDPAFTISDGQPYGFAPVYYPGVADFAAAGTIQLAAGQTFQTDLSVVRQPYYAVRIPVATAGQNGGMNIMVSVQGHRGPGYSLSYNPDKHRIEGLLPNGSYLVEVTTPGATGVVSVAVADAPVDGPNMAFTRNGSISLNVREEFTATDETGSGSSSDGTRASSRGPRAYLDVRAEGADDFGPQRSASLRKPAGPNDDSLVIEDLAPGRYWVRVRSSRGYVAAMNTGGIDLLHEPLAIGSGMTPVEIKMRDDSAQIAGTLTGVTSVPANNVTANYGPSSSSVPGASTTPAYVYCIPLLDSPGQFQQISVSPDGKFSSQKMAPGTYRVMAFKNPQSLPYRDADAMRAYDATGQIVHLEAGQKENVQLQIASSSD